jgi:assimilatory nitrate reductase catalytic subunit
MGPGLPRTPRGSTRRSPLRGGRRPTSRVAALTGLAAADVARFYGWSAATERVVTVFSQGVNQSSAGTDKVNSIINCHLATGRIGRPGMGPFSVTGQPNAMGGREVGGLANQLAAHMGFGDEAARDRVGRFWNAPNLAAAPGLKAVEMFDAVLKGRIKALWIVATNPAASMPRAARVRAALAACPFVVVSDCWPTDTTALAHVVLPAAGWGEKDGTVTNSERRISRQRPFRAPPGEARPDWWMLAQVARRMGFSESFAWDSPAAVLREHAALSGFENGGARAFDIGALATLSDADYDALEPVRWPLPAGGGAEGAGRLFADGGFPTPDGRARFVPTPWRPPTARPDAEFPLLLNTGRLRDQWHTMTRTGRAPRLMAHADAPEAAFSPADAARLGIAAGGLVRLTSAHGTAVLRPAVTPAQRPGEVFAPMHWTDAFAASGPVGRVVGAATDPVSGQPELKATPVRADSVRVHWRGLLLHRRAVRPDAGVHWSRVPVGAGHALALDGTEPLPPGAALGAIGAAARRAGGGGVAGTCRSGARRLALRGARRRERRGVPVPCRQGDGRGGAAAGPGAGGAARWHGGGGGAVWAAGGARRRGMRRQRGPRGVRVLRRRARRAARRDRGAPPDG